MILSAILDTVGARVEVDRRFSATGLEPDGYIELRYNDKTHFFYIEYDRTKKRDKWVRKMRRYPDFLDEYHEKLTGVGYALVLCFAVGGEAHAFELATWTGEMMEGEELTGYNELFLMTGEKDNLFEGEVWRNPLGKGKVRLFD